MTTSSSTYFKLGLLALATGAAFVAVVVVLGLRTLRAPTVEYHTYFDESVQGLEAGSPVKFRGVRIGTVTGIDVAPDGRHVDVTLALSEDETRRLRIDHAAPDLRTRLGSQGLTGVKFVDLDFFPDARVERLSFEPAERHIAAQPSLVKGLETQGTAITRRLPELLDHATASLTRIDRLVTHLVDARVPARMARTLERIETGVDLLGRRATVATEAFERTMDDVGEAAEAMRDLLGEIERDPDMLLKGRRP